MMWLAVKIEWIRAVYVTVHKCHCLSSRITQLGLACVHSQRVFSSSSSSFLLNGVIKSCQEMPLKILTWLTVPTFCVTVTRTPWKMHLPFVWLLVRALIQNARKYQSLTRCLQSHLESTQRITWESKWLLVIERKLRCVLAIIARGLHRWDEYSALHLWDGLESYWSRIYSDRHRMHSFLKL